MQECDQELTALITSDVMRVLEAVSFFRKLDDVLSPEDKLAVAAGCRGGYEVSEEILRASAIDSSDFSDIFCVLMAQGGECDCEILYNVSESNRLKQRYWKAKARNPEANVPPHC